MSGYDLLEIGRHRLIAERCGPLIDVLRGEDVDAVTDIMNRSKAKLDKYNKENRTVVDITKIEDGQWRGTVKKVVQGKFGMSHRKIRSKSPDYPPCYCPEDEDCTEECNKAHSEMEPIIKKYYEKCHLLMNTIDNACNNTKFPDDLKFNYILLRRTWNWPDLNPLQIALRDVIHTEILSIFQNQNQQLIQKSCNQ